MNKQYIQKRLDNFFYENNPVEIDNTFKTIQRFFTERKIYLINRIKEDNDANAEMQLNTLLDIEKQKSNGVLVSLLNAYVRRYCY